LTVRVGLGAFLFNHWDWDRVDRFAWQEAPAVPDHQVFDRDVLHLASVIEDLGYDSVWVGEHHFLPHELSPNPLQLLSFFAGATENLGLGTMVTTLPWHNPLDVAEQIALLDNLIRPGRMLQIGFGRGSQRMEFEGFRIPPHESRGRFLESLEVIRKALTDEVLHHQGEYFSYPELAMRPRPRSSDLTSRMYGAYSTPEGLEMIARSGLSPLMVSAPQSWGLYGTNLARFNDFRAEEGLEPTSPVLLCFAFCADTEEAAFELASRCIPMIGEGAKHGVEFIYGDPAGYPLTAEAFSNRKFTAFEPQANAVTEEGKAFEKAVGPLGPIGVWGTPDMCIERLRFINEVAHPREVILQTRAGTQSWEEAERTVQLIGKEVLPAVREFV
jgi:alkanesulfonate monooxygenase SsuD/methylene tetrahydromethanopterin reductase-like flavin-dependent oxidoreductase (luciferase family)